MKTLLSTLLVLVTLSAWSQSINLSSGVLLKTDNLSGLASPATAQANLLLGTMATQSSTAYMPVSAGLLIASYTNSITNLSSWTTTAYNQLVPTGTMTNKNIYLVKVTYDASGVDNITQSFVVPGATSNSGSPGTPADLISNIAAYGYGSSTTNFVKLRYKKPASGSATLGLECTISTMTLAVASATISVSITPLL